MRFSFASPNDENNVKKILQDNDLHHQDITASHLEHFLLKNLCPASAVCMVTHLNPKSFRE